MSVKGESVYAQTFWRGEGRTRAEADAEKQYNAYDGAKGDCKCPVCGRKGHVRAMCPLWPFRTDERLAKCRQLEEAAALERAKHDEPD